jgi:rRNA-processing protein FCF1
MTRQPQRRLALLVIDANVLIDYAVSDVSVLALVAKHLGQVHVPRPLLREVEQIDESVCAKLGLRVVDADLKQLTEAAGRRGRLSFEDHLCLVMGRDNGWTCVTNDGRLRQECATVGVEVLWGLQPLLLLVMLVKIGEFEAKDAVEVVDKMHAENPYITKKVVEDFKAKVAKR